MKNRNLSKGVTLVELLIVISIIGFIATVIMSSLSLSRGKAQVSKARSELQSLALAVELLVADTGRLPSPSATKPLFTAGCNWPPDINEVLADTPQAGILATDGNFPGWNGPYFRVPKDPWGNAYVYDEDYDCNASTPKASGCERYGAGFHRAVFSRGPNASAINTYDSDNVVRVLCSR